MSMVCNHCGSQVRNAASFCPKCGVALVAKTRAIPTILGLIIAGALALLMARLAENNWGDHDTDPNPVNHPSLLRFKPGEVKPPPTMEVQVIPRGLLSGLPVLRVVSMDTEPFTITRVVFNNRTGVPGCDQSVAMNEVVCEATKAKNDKADLYAAMASSGVTQEEIERMKTLWMKLDCKDKAQQRQHEIGLGNAMMGYLQEADLRTGDSLDFYPGSTTGLTDLGSCGSAIVMVDIYTDRESGARRYTFPTP